MSGDSALQAGRHGLARRSRAARDAWAAWSWPTRFMFVAAAVLVVAAATSSSILAARQDDELLRNVVIILTGGGAIAAVVTKVLVARTGRVLLDPLAGPLAYLTYALWLPLAYMEVTGSGIQVMPASILNGATVAVLCLSLSAFIAGAAVTQILTTASIPSVPEPPARDALGSRDRDRRGPIVRDVGRAILLLVLAMKVYQLIVKGPVFLRLYGEDQFTYDFDAFIGVVAASLIAVGSLLVMFGNMKVLDRPLARVDWILLGALVLVGLVLLGNRSELIAPVVLFLWFRLQSKGRFSWALAIAVVAAAGIVLAVIAQVRVKDSGAEGYPLFETLLVDTSSPVQLTSDVASRVPAQVDFYWGSTYLEALKYMLPGPLARLLFGDPTGTGVFAYRDLIDFHYPNQGFGFAVPTEAYLNFGFAGVVVVALALGILYAWAHAVAVRNRYGLLTLLYPLLVSYLAFGLRSDALNQLKNIVYPLIICALAIALERFLLRRTGGIHGPTEWRWSSAIRRHGGP